ncbi:MAG: hypothetical protein V2A76_14510 [Planctomycetota bacterium]
MTLHEDTLRVLELDAWNERVARETVSDVGREQALCARPEESLEEARRLIAETGEALELSLSERLPLLRLKDDGLTLLSRARQDGSPLLARDLAVLYRFLRAARNLRSDLNRLEACPALRDISLAMPDLDWLVHSLGLAVDEQGILLDSASPRLREVRFELSELKESMRREMERFANRREIRPLLRSSHPTLRDGRFVLAVRAGARGQIRGIYHDRSQTGNTVYVEPEHVVDDQNRLQDLLIDEHREVVRILWEFTLDLFEREQELEQARACIGRFDLARARAIMARDLGLTRPALEQGGPLALASARHPLLLCMALDRQEGEPEARLENARRATVPFDLRLGQSFDVMVLTGPNTGGKTVTLKAIGLLSLLPRAGHFLPAAEGARVPWFPGVFADVGDEQDLMQSLSTFSGHIRRVSEMLAGAERGALVLLDELGSGTDPLEGEALSTALLEHLLELGALSVVTTHLGRLKEFAGGRERATNASMEFDPHTLKPTFRLMLGIPGASNALRIAANLGLPRSVLERAGLLLSEQSRHSSELFDQLDRARAAVEKTRGEIEADRREASAARLRSHEKEEHLDRDRRALMGQAEAAAEARLRQLAEELEQPRRALLSLGGSAAVAAGQMLEALRRALAATPLAEWRREFALSLRQGDRVLLPKYNEICTVTRILRKEERVELTYRRLSVTVEYDEIAPIEQSHLYRSDDTP